MASRNYQLVESRQAPRAAVRRKTDEKAGSRNLRHYAQRRWGPNLALILALFALVFRFSPVTAQVTAAPRPTASSEPKFVGLSKWPVDRDDPESSIPTAAQRDSNPLEFGYFLMDVSELAEAALRRGKHLEAIKFFKALAKAVPDKAVSYRKICISYQALGDWQNAMAYCATALTREGLLPEDFERYARIIVDMKPSITQKDAEDLDAIAAHLQTQVPESTLADEITCETGLRLQDNRRMKECTDRLTISAPNNPKTLTYRWAFALQRGDTAAARHVIDEARRLAIPPAIIRKMEDATGKFTHLSRWRWLSNRTVVLAAVLLILIAGGGATLVMRRRQSAATG